MASVPTGTFLTAQYVKKRTRLNTVTEAPTFKVEDLSPNTEMLNVPPNRPRFFSWGAQDMQKSNLLNVPGKPSVSSPGILTPSSTTPGVTPAPSPIFKFFHSNYLNVPSKSANITVTSPGGLVSPANSAASASPSPASSTTPNSSSKFFSNVESSKRG